MCTCTVADPGFSVGGMNPFGRGRGPPMQGLFGENVCENERIGSHKGGGMCQKILYVDLPMHVPCIPHTTHTPVLSSLILN